MNNDYKWLDATDIYPSQTTDILLYIICLKSRLSSCRNNMGVQQYGDAWKASEGVGE